MNWEETIYFIQNDKNYSTLVQDAYLSSNLVSNIDRFRNSKEFAETLSQIKLYKKNAVTLLDIGCGNGISSIGFALEGFNVTCIEPDNSDIVGCGAINKMKDYYNLNNLLIIQGFAENIELPKDFFDIIYTRQSLHHAADLYGFVKNCSKFLKTGGIWFSVRDHVIFNQSDKEWFLNTHPLHKFYHGENAFQISEYLLAFKNANFKMVKIFKYYDSIINYFPESEISIKRKKNEVENNIEGFIKRNNIPNTLFIKRILKFFYIMKYGEPLSEKKVPGRLYSFIGEKK